LDQLKVTVWLWPSFVVDAFDTRVPCEICVTSPAERLTVCECPADPAMSRSTEFAAVSCAAVITATWPCLPLIVPDLSPDDGVGVGVGAGGVGLLVGVSLPPHEENVIVVPLTAAVTAPARD